MLELRFILKKTHAVHTLTITIEDVTNGLA
jgi:hypothetical protein